VSRTNQPAVTISELRSHLGFWLRFVSNHVSNAFARRILDRGVTVAEWVVLREMYGRNEVAPSTLADEIGMTRGAVSKLIDRLVGKRLVTRQDRSDDRRFQDVGLTAAGRRLVPALASIADQNDMEFFLPLSARERELLAALLKKLVQAHNLHKIPTE
jgi:DNA-binding MarR family transcriptional regulator